MKMISKIKQGEAATRLLKLRRRLAHKRRTCKTKPISENVKTYLYNKG